MKESQPFSVSLVMVPFDYIGSNTMDHGVNLSRISVASCSPDKHSHMQAFVQKLVGLLYQDFWSTGTNKHRPITYSSRV